MTDQNPADVIAATVLLGDADADLRLRAAVDLGTWRAVSAAHALVDRLGREPSHAIRETLTWALLRMSDAARPLLHDALAAPNWLSRMQAGHVLSKLGAAYDVAALLPVIADPVEAVAARAWWAAGRTSSAQVVDALAAQLGRGDSDLRNSLSIAFEELAAIGVPALVERVQRSSCAAVREHAADALGLIGSPAAEPAVLPLRELLLDADAGVRFAAVNALGQLDSPSSRDAVRSARDHDDARVRGLAQRLCGRHRWDAPTPVPSDGAELAEGVVSCTGGILVRLACRSAGVARSAALRELGGRIAQLAALRGGSTVAALLATRLPSGSGPAGATVAEALQKLSARAGEPVVLAELQWLEGPCFTHLQAGPEHHPGVGVLIGYRAEPGPETERILDKLARQVALTAPCHLTVAEVPDQVWAGLRANALDRARAGGVPERFREHVEAGAVADYATAHVLLKQVSVTDPGVTIEGLLHGRGIHLTALRRVAVGSAPR